MITAKEAREIYETAQKVVAKEVWEEIKEGLFAAIRSNAKARCEGLTFGVHDEVGKFKKHGGSWITQSHIREKVMNELSKEPFSFKVNYDFECNQMTINW